MHGRAEGKRFSTEWEHPFSEFILLLIGKSNYGFFLLFHTLEFDTLSGKIKANN